MLAISKNMRNFANEIRK